MANKLKIPPITILNVKGSFKNTLAIDIAKKGTEKIKILAFDGPNIGV
jgi:hypothetical protein